MRESPIFAARRQIVLKHLDQLISEVENSPPGEELRHTEEVEKALGPFLRRLGFPQGPIERHERHDPKAGISYTDVYCRDPSGTGYRCTWQYGPGLEVKREGAKPKVFRAAVLRNLSRWRLAIGTQQNVETAVDMAEYLEAHRQAREDAPKNDWPPPPQTVDDPRRGMADLAAWRIRAPREARDKAKEQKERDRQFIERVTHRSPPKPTPATADDAATPHAAQAAASVFDKTAPHMGNERKPLPPARQAAWESYEYAVGSDPALAESTDAGVWKWLNVRGMAGYRLPPQKTWIRYLKRARAYYGCQKNSARSGRSGRSIVHRSQID